FNSETAAWVAQLSKDKRLEEHEREEQYVAGLAHAPWQVKVCKLADMFDNLLDTDHLSAAQRARTFGRLETYLRRLADALPEQARRPWQIVSGLLAEMKTAGESG